MESDNGDLKETDFVVKGFFTKQKDVRAEIVFCDWIGRIG